MTSGSFPTYKQTEQLAGAAQSPGGGPELSSSDQQSFDYSMLLFRILFCEIFFSLLLANKCFSLVYFPKINEIS